MVVKYIAYYSLYKYFIKINFLDSKIYSIWQKIKIHLYKYIGAEMA